MPQTCSSHIMSSFPDISIFSFLWAPSAPLAHPHLQAWVWLDIHRRLWLLTRAIPSLLHSHHHRTRLAHSHAHTQRAPHPLRPPYPIACMPMCPPHTSDPAGGIRCSAAAPIVVAPMAPTLPRPVRPDPESCLECALLMLPPLRKSSMSGMAEVSVGDREMSSGTWARSGREQGGGEPTTPPSLNLNPQP